MSADLFETFVGARDERPGALDAFLKRGGLIIHAWCRQWQSSLLVRRRLVDDVVQDSLFQVWRNYRTCRATTGRELTTWLRSIARHCAISVLRRDFPERRELIHVVSIDTNIEQEVAFSGETDETDEIAGLLAAEILAALDRTSDATVREVLWLRLVGGRSWWEIGKELGISWTAARRRYQRAIERARAHLHLVMLRDKELGAVAALLLRRLAREDDAFS